MVKLITALIFTAAITSGFYVTGSSASAQSGPDILKDNSCVACHSRTSSPSDLAARFLEWHVSAHAAAKVGCEKCHGGDASATDAERAHQGVHAPSESNSTLSEANVSRTCGACHDAIARSFVESTHYRKLVNSGMGPSCISCHGHMASATRRSGPEGEALCTYCHNSVNGLLPPRPDIPANSKATLDAIQRTQYLITWIGDLLAKAEAKHIPVEAERREAASLRASIEGSKIAWHTFNVEGVKEMANKSYAQAVQLKERLAGKLAE